MHPLFQSHFPQHLCSNLFPLCFWYAPEHQRHCHIFQCCMGSHQIIGLEDKSDVPLTECRQTVLSEFGDIVFAYVNSAPGWFFQTSQLIEQGTLTGTGCTQNTAYLAFLDLQVDIVQCYNLFAAKLIDLSQILDGDDGFQAIPPNGTGFFALYWFIRL